jgi:RNA polymerase sigma factor (sigma-70 family)
MSAEHDGQRGGFPTTAVSQVLAVRSADPAVRAMALRVLAIAYLGPVYKYTRLKWNKSSEEARDITQEFFATALEHDTFAAYDPERARFRTFLRVCLDRFISNRIRELNTLKRGGGAQIASFDFDAVERDLARAPVASPPSPEDYFHHEWIRELLRTSVAALREELESKHKLVHFHVFESIELCEDPSQTPSYAELAARVGLSVTDVTNRLSYARRVFREVVLRKLRELTASEEEFREEARAVLGVDPA